jgi:hypothetical protein
MWGTHTCQGLNMASVLLQIVCKPLPHIDENKVVASLKEAAEHWRRAGAEVKIYSVSVGELGKLLFTARWNSYTAYGETMDKLTRTESVQNLMGKILKSGNVEWVRGNLARELPV